MIPNTIEKTPEGGLSAANCSLILGDCLEMMKHIPDGSVDMVMCDLPYGTTQNKWDSVIPLEPLWAQYRRVCKKNAAIVLTASQPFTSALVMSNLQWFKWEDIWHKTRAVGHLNSKVMPMREHENILVFGEGRVLYNPQMTEKPKENIRPLSKRTKKSSNYGNHGLEQTREVPINVAFPRSVVRFHNSQDGHHPTQKPVALMEYLIRTYTNEGETVLDNTMGSGTTGVACINTGRRFIGIERDAEYFRVASERISSANSLQS